MTRKIGQTQVTIEAVATPQPGQTVHKWLEAQVSDADGTFYLLAHADDGVIWGRLAGGTLVTAPETDFSPPLRLETLQSARLFSDAGEVLLWKDGDQRLQARLIIDGDGEAVEYFDEGQILWGTQAKAIGDSFSQMSDGAQGLCHIAPIAIANFQGNHRPLRLTVRHYLSEDVNGFVRVACSRLVTLFAE